MAKAEEVKSEFERTFGVQYRLPGAGRPPRSQGGAGATMFRKIARDKALAAQAARRAQAVVMHENRERATEVYEQEYAFLVQMAALKG